MKKRPFLFTLTLITLTGNIALNATEIDNSLENYRVPAVENNDSMPQSSSIDFDMDHSFFASRNEARQRILKREMQQSLNRKPVQKPVRRRTPQRVYEIAKNKKNEYRTFHERSSRRRKTAHNIVTNRNYPPLSGAVKTGATNEIRPYRLNDNRLSQKPPTTNSRFRIADRTRNKTQNSSLSHAFRNLKSQKVIRQRWIAQKNY